MIPGLMPLAATRLPTLGDAATVGNAQAAPSPQEQLAALLAQHQQSKSRLAMGEQMQGEDYIANSGSLGVLAALANRYMGGRIRRKEGERASDLTQRILRAQTDAERAKLIEAERAKLAAERERMAQRRKDADRLGVRGDAANRFELTGDLPTQGRSTPVWTSQGLMAFDPTTSTYMPAQMAGADGVPVKIDLDPNLSPEERAAHMAAITADMQGGVATGAGASAAMPPASPNAPLTPYVDPRHMRADARAERQLELAERSADRADKAELRAERTASQGEKPLTAEAATKLALIDNAIRPAEQWVSLVTNPDGSYNDVKARSPQAQALLTQAIRSKLRAESGATITAEEVAGELERYMGGNVMGIPGTGGLLSSDSTNTQRAGALLDDLRRQREAFVPGKSAAPPDADRRKSLLDKY